MTPIINPMYFYWISVLESFNGILAWLLVLTSIYLIVVLVNYGIKKVDSDLYSCGDDEEEEKLAVAKTLWGKSLKPCVAIVTISSILLIFIPSEQTIYRMMIAKYATGDNIEEVTEAIKDGVDYIFDKINGENATK